MNPLPRINRNTKSRKAIRCEILFYRVRHPARTARRPTLLEVLELTLDTCTSQALKPLLDKYKYLYQSTGHVTLAPSSFLSTLVILIAIDLFVPFEYFHHIDHQTIHSMDNDLHTTGLWMRRRDHYAP